MATEDDGGFSRSVTPMTGSRPDQQMDVIGWLIFLTMVIVLLPLLPVIALIWVLSKLVR